MNFDVFKNVEISLSQKVIKFTDLSNAFNKTLQAVDFPLPEGPTIINP